MDTVQLASGEFAHIIQSPEVSSTASIIVRELYAPIATSTPIKKLFPTGRVSYRTHIMRGPNRICPPTNNCDVSCNTDSRAKSTSSSSTRGSIFALASVFVSTLILLWWFYQGLPELQKDEKQYMKLPLNLDDAKNLGNVLYKYKDDHFYRVYFGISITYIFLQMFAIPGSMFLSILSGFLFSFPLAMCLVATCSTIGASLCYLISHLLGRRIILRFFPEKAALWGATVAKHQSNMLNYMIFLRITPLVPNWFINLTAPVIGVQLVPFALGTFLGVMPPSFVALQAGQTLRTMTAEDAKFSWMSVSLLIVFGFVALLPIYFKDRLKKKFD